MVAFCGLIIALSMVLMMLTVLPNFTYALPALAGALLVAVVIEVGIKYAFLSYFAVAFLSFLLAPDKFSVLLYFCFFGYYPVLKAIFEKSKSKILMWGLKLINFNSAVFAAYFLSAWLLNMQENSLFFMDNYLVLLGILAAANIVFFIYDGAVNNVIGFYLKRLHNSVINVFKAK